MALENLMCKRVPVPCADNPEATCSTRLECRDPNAVHILEILKTLVGITPMNETTFIGNFNPVTIKPWKGIILRYTRVPY
jgi:hypothetical protein